MITVYGFNFKEEVKEEYKDYKRAHKVLYTNGEKTTAIFSKNNTITKDNISLMHVDVDKQPLGYCCTVDIKQRQRNGVVRTNVTFLVPRSELNALHERKLKYLQSLQGVHGKLIAIINIDYTEGVDTHAKVVALFSKSEGEY